MNTVYSKATDAGFKRIKFISTSLICCYVYYAITLIHKFNIELFETALFLFIAITFTSALDAWFQLQLDDCRSENNDLSLFKLDSIDAAVLASSITLSVLVAMIIQDVYSLCGTVVIMHFGVTLFYSISMAYLHLLYIKYVGDFFISIITLIIEMILLFLEIAIAYNSLLIPLNLVIGISVVQLLVGCVGIIVKHNKERK